MPSVLLLTKSNYTISPLVKKESKVTISVIVRGEHVRKDPRYHHFFCERRTQVLTILMFEQIYDSGHVDVRIKR